MPTASPATSDRSSSLLPAPVVPATSAWGPSRTRSTSIGPSAATASRVRSGGSPPAACQPRRTSSGSVAQPAREQRRQGHGGRQPGAGRRLLGVVPAGEREGHGPSRRRRRARRDDVVAQLGAAGPVEDGRAVGSCLDDDVADAGERRGRVRDDQRGAGPVGGEQLADRRSGERPSASDRPRRAPGAARTVHPAEPGRRATREGRRPSPPAGRRTRDRGRGAASAASPAPASPARSRRPPGGRRGRGRRPAAGPGSAPAVGRPRVARPRPRPRRGRGRRRPARRGALPPPRRAPTTRRAPRRRPSPAPAAASGHRGPRRRRTHPGRRPGAPRAAGPAARAHATAAGSSSASARRPRRDGRLVGREIGGDGRERGARPLAVGPPPRPSTQPRPQRGGQRAQRADRAEDEERRLVQQQRDDGTAGEGHDDRRAGR